MSVFDVAARAGVSIATVSRVMNNSRRVNPEIAALVKKAAEELKYSPQRVHRKDKDKAAEIKGGTVAIVSIGQSTRGWFEVPVIAATIAAVSRVAEQAGQSMTITEMEEPSVLSPALKRKDIIGAIAFVSGALHEAAAAKLAGAVPTVRILGGQFAPPEVDHVTVDNNAVGYIAAKRLVEQGCRKLAFLTVSPTWHFVRLRSHGFAVAAAEAGATAVDLVPGQGGAVSEFGRTGELVQQLLDQRCDGVFVARDEETVWVYRELKERGIRPGKDIQIISCDNDAVRLSTLDPRPASIELGIKEIAANAVRRLNWRIKHPHAPPVRILVNPHLVVPEEGAAAGG